MISKIAWRRILNVASGLVILVVLIIAFFVIPRVKEYHSAVNAFWVIVFFQLLMVAALIYSILFSHHEGHFENGFLVTAGIILILLSLILIDAAAASLNPAYAPTSAILLFICIGLDFIAGVLSFIARYFRGHLKAED
jgi:hypothetical protein